MSAEPAEPPKGSLWLPREDKLPSSHSPDPDVRPIRNIWARKGVLERVRGVKFMWGIFACNELLHRRFGRLDSSSCSCCTVTDETPWHVIGECNDAGAVDTRICWADRMWDVLQKETVVQKGETALRVDVANAVRRLWKVDADMGGSLRGLRERPAHSAPA
jgi:hypothetical protein